MGYALFAISGYIAMRSLEVIFMDRKDDVWFKRSIKVVACAVLYTAIASMLWFYFNHLLLLGFDPR